MLVAVYHCLTHEAMVALLGNLDPHETMQVIDFTRQTQPFGPDRIDVGYVVVYTSRSLRAVATDPDIAGVFLKSQVFID